MLRLDWCEQAVCNALRKQLGRPQTPDKSKPDLTETGLQAMEVAGDRLRVSPLNRVIRPRTPLTCSMGYWSPNSASEKLDQEKKEMQCCALARTVQPWHACPQTAQHTCILLLLLLLLHGTPGCTLCKACTSHSCMQATSVLELADLKTEDLAGKRHSMLHSDSKCRILNSER